MYEKNNYNHYEDDLYQDDIIFHYVIQYYIKSGLDNFRKRVERKFSADIQQLHMRDVFYILNPRSLSKKHK